MLPTINAVWVGDTLGAVHAACLRSFLRHGHRVVLHSFEAIVDVPRGIELVNAENLMERSEIVRYKKNGSLALTANIYRYRILQEGLGIYVDCDVFCLRPFPEQKFLFGKESDICINNAVLNVPAEHPLLDTLIEASNDPYFIPWWLPPKKQRRRRIRKAIGFSVHISHQPWGTIGPRLLTRAVERHGLTNQAMPIDVFYPCSFYHTDLLFEPGLSVEDLVTHRSLGIHLWHSALVNRRNIPKGCPMDEIIHSL